MPGPVFIEGDRINLRTVEKEDAGFMRDVKNLPEIRAGMTIRFPISRGHEEEFYEDVVLDRDDESVRLMITREEETLGMIELSPDDMYSGTGSIVIWLKPEAQGKGYGTEAASELIDHAFSELRYHRLTAKALESNPASQKVWEKLGFAEEGVRRKSVYTQGEYQDLKLYGLLENEWDR
ncbi:MAG: GNAT family N-acetyltransferase [Candidatus Nanohaloarchaea archaeon]